MRLVSRIDARGWVRLLVLARALGGCSGETVVEEPAEPEPAAPVEVLPRQSAEVSFLSTDLQLEGTLLVPERASDERLPAVILGHGSGPIDRDEILDGQLGMGFGFDLPVFGELAEALGDAGYVVLRYDKRSCTVRTGCQNAYPPTSGSDTVDDYVNDLKAGLDWLHTQSEVDGDRLYYVGHSQGGQFAPGLLASRADLKAAVMLAGPYSPVDELLQNQASFLRELVLSLGGPSDSPEQRALEQGVLQIRQLREGTFTGGRIMGESTSQWRSWMELGDRAQLLVDQLDRPLLALSGDYDWNVLPEETDAWRDALRAVPNDPGHEAVILPCVSHALNCIAQPDVQLLREEDFGRNIDPRVPAEIVRFLSLHGGTRAAVIRAE